MSTPTITPIIAIDAMGGDHGIPVTVLATRRALLRDGQLRLILVGHQEALEAALAAFPAPLRTRVSIQHASQVVAMDDDPAQALRAKKDSSMRRAIELVKEGVAQACVSAGNTGALLAKSRFVLKTLPGIDRPAIMTALPTYAGRTHMLDLGANVDCSAEQLYQFAVMGTEAVAALHDMERPRVGLLNIGHEAIKGNEQVKRAARLLSSSNLNYIGYVEGDALYQDVADVVVCDGFVGNVALKSSEGAAKMVAHYLRQEFNRNWRTRLLGLVALPVLRQLRQRIDPRQYNGASLLGLRGIVVKSHGSADALAFANAVQIAQREVAHNLPEHIGVRIAQHLLTPQVNNGVCPA